MLWLTYLYMMWSLNSFFPVGGIGWKVRGWASISGHHECLICTRFHGNPSKRCDSNFYWLWAIYIFNDIFWIKVCQLPLFHQHTYTFKTPSSMKWNISSLTQTWTSEVLCFASYFPVVLIMVKGKSHYHTYCTVKVGTVVTLADHFCGKRRISGIWFYYH